MTYINSQNKEYVDLTAINSQNEEYIDLTKNASEKTKCNDPPKMISNYMQSTVERWLHFIVFRMCDELESYGIHKFRTDVKTVSLGSSCDG